MERVDPGRNRGGRLYELCRRGTKHIDRQIGHLKKRAEFFTDVRQMLEERVRILVPFENDVSGVIVTVIPVVL